MKTLNTAKTYDRSAVRPPMRAGLGIIVVAATVSRH